MILDHVIHATHRMPSSAVAQIFCPSKHYIHDSGITIRSINVSLINNLSFILRLRALLTLRGEGRRLRRQGMIAAAAVIVVEVILARSQSMGGNGCKYAGD